MKRKASDDIKIESSSPTPSKCSVLSPSTSKCPVTSQEVESKPEEASDKPASDDSWEIPQSSTWMSREFDVLDEFYASNDPIDEDLLTSDDDEYENRSDDSFDSDVPDEEIEAMLEEGLPEQFKGKKGRGVGAQGEDSNRLYLEKEKTVLDEKGRNHFDVLPEGWVQVTHNSGMPVYLHKKTRVCTMAMPYFLGPGSARKHEVPLSSIPCLQYQRAKENELLQKQEDQEKKDAIAECPAATNGATDKVMSGLPSAKIETVQENRASHSLNATQMRDYCGLLFNFKNIKVMRFPSWSARRQYTKHKKQQKQLQRPSLPEGTKLITFPVQNSEHADGSEGGGSKGKKEWVMNPNGKSYVCILHEYVQHALKKQPAYDFKELENAATPYSATVVINDMQYGQGFGTSKKQAKSEAAKATLEILIPEMRDKIQQDSKGRYTNKEPDLCFFDDIKIEDARVADLCAKTCEPSPYAILLICLQRNFGLGNMSVDYEVNTSRHQKNEFTMKVGKHEAKVVCKNKRDGKQRASQAILQTLHPHVSSWGSLLRMYGNRSVKSIKEKKQEEQEITLLQSKAAVNSPNFAILNKLKQEMQALHAMRAAVQPIGKFIPPDNISMPSSSGADLNNVDL